MLEITIRGHAPTDLLGIEETAVILGTTPGNLNVMRALGRGPAFEKPDGWRVAYRAEALTNWLANTKPWTKPRTQKVA